MLPTLLLNLEKNPGLLLLRRAPGARKIGAGTESSGWKLAPIRSQLRKLRRLASEWPLGSLQSLSNRVRARLALWAVVLAVALLPKRKAQKVVVFQVRTGKPPSPLVRIHASPLEGRCRAFRVASKFRAQLTIFFE